MAIRILEGRIDRVRQRQEAPAEGPAPGDVLGAGAPPLQTPEQEVGLLGTNGDTHHCCLRSPSLSFMCLQVARQRKQFSNYGGRGSLSPLASQHSNSVSM